MLERVGLDGSDPTRYSHELSGGQRQRVGIARALILEPDFVVCDEAVSSIDFALKKQILKLLVDLKKKNGTTYLFISHDMAAVKAVCDRIMVMYLGNILEILPSANAEVIHPYTQALMAATLEPDPTVRREKKVLFKEDGAQTIPKAGCAFSPGAFTPGINVPANVRN
ncbi:MAG: ABC transporter ATP-binding protein, partial [Oscillospiraceae bacterium]